MLGKGKNVRVKQICGDVIEDDINKALEELSGNEILDIKFGKTATQGDYGADVLIIYKPKNKSDENFYKQQLK